MLTKFIGRPHSLTFLPPTLFPSFPKPLTLSFLSTSAAAAATSLSATSDQTLPFGPSLTKGRQSEPPVELISENVDVLLDEDCFTRVFDIAALRVPSDRCFSLENRLRGHLLNWPRIRNIARVTGDEIDDDFKHIVQPNSGDTDGLVLLNRRIYGRAEGDGEALSPVLYRDKLAKTFDSTGYMNFRNLAKMSRPKKRKKKEERGEKKGVGRNEVYLVEVVCDESENEEDFSGLLGEEYKGRKWRGSTRLLLMDEQYANKSMEEMPGAIKVSVPTLLFDPQ